MYAYVSTPTDNRVIRIADGDVPKPILTGIPKGATGNMGSLIFTSPTTLVVQTGDAGDPAAGGRPGFAGRQGAAHRAAHNGQPGAADHRADRDGRRRRPVHRSVGRLPLHHRPHPDRRPAAAHHQGLEGVDGVDLARSPGRGGLRRAGRHGAGQSRQHQADGGGAAGTGHRRGHRRARGGPSGPARTRVGAAARRPTATCGARRSTRRPATPRSSTTSCSRCSRRAADSRAATPTTPRNQQFRREWPTGRARRPV